MFKIKHLGTSDGSTGGHRISSRSEKKSDGTSTKIFQTGGYRPAPFEPITHFCHY